MNQEQAQKLVYSLVSKTLPSFVGKAPDNKKNPVIVFNNIYNNFYGDINNLVNVNDAQRRFTYQIDIYTDTNQELLTYKQQVIEDFHQDKRILITDTQDSKSDDGFRSMINISVFI